MTIFLEARNLSLSIGPRKLFDIDRFELFDGDRVGLVGENGVGKTTLLNALAGQVQLDSGTVLRHKEITLIHQFGDSTTNEFSPELAARLKVENAREGLSGGELTRRRISEALTHPNGVLFADEPTSDLDLSGIKELTHQLKNYRGAIVLVSHDRTLLNEICNRIIELEGQTLVSYSGNYDDYTKEKQHKRDFQQFEYEQYRQEQARLTAAIKQRESHAQSVTKLPKRMGNSEARLHKRSATEIEEKLHKSSKALESRLMQLEEKERPLDLPSIRMGLGLRSSILSKTAIESSDLCIAFDHKVILHHASFKLPTGTKTALIGNNGSGKSTLARYIMENLPPIRISPGVKLGWFDQAHENTLDSNKPALENVMYTSIHDEATCRTVLARLMLRGDDVFKPVSVLSGGERAKVALAKLFMADINTLVLDEPTNHIDIYTLEALQELLVSFAGTLLLISHDRRFISATCQRLLIIEEKQITTYEGSYSEYENRQKVAPVSQNLLIELETVKMNMAMVSSRIAIPARNKNIDELNQQYEELLGRKGEIEALIAQQNTGNKKKGKKR